MTAKTFCPVCGLRVKPATHSCRPGPKSYCRECGTELVQTSARYVACPLGHGPLIQRKHIDISTAAIVADDREFEQRLRRAGL